ncbi:Cell surface mannoprotein mp65 [Neonectria magnoliae]|uniref:Cell surface mannoprotein mp65 n=1 Tax=Neonectria magnoliae TaxID=2732573 RepID=A0ABR1HYE2_9HYPO
MTLAKFLVSALGMAAAAAFPIKERELVTTTTLYTTSTLTHYIASATTPSALATPTPSSSNSTDTKLPGIAYAPYRGDHNCKTEAQVNDDFSKFNGSYSLVRIYGTDCDQVSICHSAAKDIQVRLFLGIWDIDAVVDEAQRIIDGINGDWDIVHTVSVGNELVNNGKASPEKVVSAVKKARSILRAAGYKGPVVTVDTFVAATAHPELCRESDYCAINAHGFFDSTITADEAGSWLTRTVANLQDTLPSDKKVMVTESGWPCKGLTNGLAVPGASEQQAAITSIKKAFANKMSDLILFSAFNTPWKSEEKATFNAEPFWGIDGAISSSDM